MKKGVGGCVKERKVGSRKTFFAWVISLGKAAVLCRYNNNAVHTYMVAFAGFFCADSFT